MLTQLSTPAGRRLSTATSPLAALAAAVAIITLTVGGCAADSADAGSEPHGVPADASVAGAPAGGGSAGSGGASGTGAGAVGGTPGGAGAGGRGASGGAGASGRGAAGAGGRGDPDSSLSSSGGLAGRPLDAGSADSRARDSGESNLPSCSAGAPALGAHCSMTESQACLLGGYGCLCQCRCVGGPPQCSEPCTWTCAFSDFEHLIHAGDVSVVLDCTSSLAAPLFRITAPVELNVPSGGPALTVTSIGAYLELDKAGQSGRPCSLNDAGTPAAVGPIPPGTSQPVSELRGGACADVGLGDVCAYCGGTARVYLGVNVSGNGMPDQSNDWPLGVQPQGTPVPLHCVGP